MHAHRQASAWGHIEHVTHAKQRFCALLIQNRAAINFAADLERDSGWHVRFD